MSRLFYFLLFFIIVDSSARDWDVIKKSGLLKVGVRDKAHFVYMPSDKEYPGFTYEMARDFAEQHGLKLELVIVPAFADYWKKDGEILLKKDSVATPDIYRDIDIAAEIFTVTKERKRLVHLAPYIDNVELFFGAQGLNIRSYEGLIGRRVLTYEVMSFFKIITDELKKREIPYEITYVKPMEGSIQVPKGHNDKNDKVNLYVFAADTDAIGGHAYHPVAQKMVDIGLNDAISVIHRIFGNSFYKENLRPLFPAQQNHTQLAWGSAKSDFKLNKKIEEFIEDDYSSGRFSKRLQKYVGMTLEEYKELIEMIK